MTAKAPATKEQLQERAHLVRIHEANCNIPYPTPEEAKFRAQIMKALGFELGLDSERSSGEAAAVTPAAKRAQSSAGAQTVPAGNRPVR